MVALTAGALVVGACAGPDSTGRPAGPADTPAPSPVIPSEQSAEVLRAARVFGDPAPIGGIQADVGIAPVMLTPGVYQTDALGTSVTLTLSEPWRLESEHPGSIVLTEPGAGLEAVSPVVAFHRPIGYSESWLADDPLPGATPAGWRSDLDMRGWLSTMDQVTVTDAGQELLAGRDVDWWDLEIDVRSGATTSACYPGPCVRLLWSGNHSSVVARANHRTRIYEIPDPEGAIVLVVTDDGASADFASRVDALLGGIELGPSMPHPVPPTHTVARELVLPAGSSWSFAGIPGLSFTPSEEVAVLQRPSEVALVPALFADAAALAGPTSRLSRGAVAGMIAVVVPVSDGKGRPVSSADDIIAELTREAEAEIPGRTREVQGLTAREISFRRGGEAVFLLHPGHEQLDTKLAEWPSHEHGRGWVFDGPLGPTMVVITGDSEEVVDQLRRTELDDVLHGIDMVTDRVEDGG